MSISKINANQAVSFQGKPKVSGKKTFATDKKETIKKAAIVVGGLTAATLATIALIKKVKSGKAVKPAVIPGTWQPKTNPGQEIETFNKSVQKALNAVRTAELNEQIAQVESNIAKHDLNQLKYEDIFTSSAFVNNEVVSRASLDVEKAKAEAAEIMENLAKKAAK